MIWTWNLDPVAFTLPFIDWPVRWYGLVYGLGALGAMWAVPKIWQRFFAPHIAFDVTQSELEDLVFYTFLWGVVGGRVLNTVFYTPELLLSDPLELIRVWNGGMSIHGGIIASLGYLVYWARKNAVQVLHLTDLLVLPLSFILIFGRLANFVNGEIWGYPTNADWGVVFPHVDAEPRHPSQLYAVGKNLFLTFVLSGLMFHKAARTPGLMTGFFLFFYGLIRTILHWYRVTDSLIFGVPVGQALSILMLLIGSWMVFSLLRVQRREDRERAQKSL